MRYLVLLLLSVSPVYAESLSEMADNRAHDTIEERAYGEASRVQGPHFSIFKYSRSLETDSTKGWFITEAIQAGVSKLERLASPQQHKLATKRIK